MSVALKLENVHYHYRSDMLLRSFHALKGVSIEVREGEFFGFLGHNGGGKTTTIKSILGLIRPSQGRIEIFGQSSRTTASRKLVGYLPEQPYFYDHLTVAELLALYGSLVGLQGAALNTRIEQVLVELGIESRSKNRMRTLSKGLTQRVAMAQAIIGEPRLLILDEPFSGLDPVGRKDFRELLLKLKRVGTTIFISTHIISDIEYLCDRASIIVQGELKGVFDLRNYSEIAPGTYELGLLNCSDELHQELSRRAVEATRQEQVSTYRYDSRTNGESALAAAIAAGTSIESYNFVHPNLEDLFVKLVGQQEVR